MRPPPDDFTTSREQSLLAAARAGDTRAFDALIAPHLSALRARVRRAACSRPDVDPDEIVQDALVRSYQALDVFDLRYSFAQYLFGIAKYAVRRHLCATRREIAVAWQAEPDESGTGTVLPLAEALPQAAHALVGAERFPRPDERMLARARLRELLEAFATVGGYPHQQVAFAYAMILWGERKRPSADGRPAGAPARQRPDKVPVTSDPDRVVRELSDTPLALAGKAFMRELEALEQFGQGELSDPFAAFEHRLGLTGAELFARDRVSARQFAQLGPRIIGDTRLGDYYGRYARKSVADWIAAVKVRLDKYFAGRLDLSRCPFPMLPGVDNPGPQAVRRPGLAAERGRADRAQGGDDGAPVRPDAPTSRARKAVSDAG